MLLSEEKKVHGKTLRDLIDAKLSMAEGIELFAALCRSLQARGGLYELSPDKISRDHRGNFIFSMPTAVITESRSMLGAGYLAPERLRGEKLPSLQGALFSLGALFYELLSGRRAFSGKNDMEVVLATLDGRLTPLAQIAPYCPQPLCDLCHQMLSPLKEGRPSSLAEVLSVLESYLSSGAETTQAATPSAAPEVIKVVEPISGSSPGSSSGQPVSSIPNRMMELSGPLAPTMESKPSEPRGKHRPRIEFQLPRTGEERYQIEGEIARGGLGKITRANDRQMQRTVAIKETLKHVPGDAEQRFFREAFITAKLEHPSIIPIHELGRWSNGSAYYTMKLVAGQSFEKTIAANQTLPARLALLPNVLAACEAMAYAHSQRVIHRDLKPHNILVGSFGETLVIDWGIAKELGNGEQGTGNGEDEQREPESPYREEPESGELTKEGAIIGTPAYMPLEQAKGKPVDARADVYSLGAILYHLLTGKPPYTGKRSVAVLKNLLEGPPEPISVREPEAPRELIAIVEKAMAREASDRYPTAKELADDLKKYLTGQLVGAHSYSLGEILRRWVKRNRIVLGVAAAALAVLSIGAAYSVNRIIDERNIAQSERARADEKALAEQEARQLAQLAEATKTALAKERTIDLARATLETDPAKALTYIKSLTQFPEFNEWGLVRALTAEALSRGVPEFINAEWRTEGAHHTKKVNWVEYSPSGSLLATASDDGAVILWDLKTKKGTTLSGHTGAVYTVRFSPDEKLLASAGDDGDVRVWDVATGKLQMTLKGHTQRVCNIKFSPDGKLIGSASTDSTARLWELSTGASTLLQGHTAMVLDLDFSSDGGQLATASFDGTIRLWSTKTGATTSLQGHEGGVFQVRFLPDGKRLASSSADHEVILWDIKTRAATRLLTGSAQNFFRALEVNNEHVVAADSLGDVYLWDLSSCTQRSCDSTLLRGHKGQIFNLSFSPDGKTLASAGADQSIRLWDLTLKREQRTLLGHHGIVWRVMFSPDGKSLVSSSEDTRVCLWSLLELEKGAYYDESPVSVLAYSPDGSLLASGDTTGGITIRDASGAVLRRLKANDDTLFSLLFSPDGAILVSQDETRLVFWDTKTGTILWEDSDPERSIQEIRFSPGSKQIFGSQDKKDSSGEWKTSLLVWDLITHQRSEIAEIKPAFLDVAPHAKLLAWANEELFVRLSSQDGKKLQELPIPAMSTAVRFSPDGRWLAAGSVSSPVSLWAIDGERASDAVLLNGHRGAISGLSFAPDSSSLASSGDDGTVRVWDLKSRVGRVLSSRGSEVLSVAFSPDGRSVAFASENLIQIAADDLPKDGASLLSFLEGRESPPR